jgi:hypothetical protein
MVKAMMVKGKMEVRMGNVTREERDTRTDNQVGDRRCYR